MTTVTIDPKSALKRICAELNAEDAAALLREWDDYRNAETDAERRHAETRAAGLIFDLLVEIYPSA